MFNSRHNILLDTEKLKKKWLKTFWTRNSKNWTFFCIKFLSVEFNAEQTKFLSCLENQKFVILSKITKRFKHAILRLFGPACTIKLSLRVFKSDSITFYAIFEPLGFNKRNCWPLEIKDLKNQILNFFWVVVVIHSYLTINWLNYVFLSVDYIETKFLSISCSEKPKTLNAYRCHSCPCPFWKTWGRK